MSENHDKMINARIPISDYEGLKELVNAHRYVNDAGAIRQAIKCLLGKENVAPCRHCGKMKILDTDGLCRQCAQAKEAGT